MGYSPGGCKESDMTERLHLLTYLRALPRIEQQRHLPSGATEIEPHAATASTTPVGVQGGVRHSVLQGIWWDRSLDSWMFLGTDFMISILNLLISREALNPFMVTSDRHD